MGIGDVSIDLSGANVRMAEQRLDRAKVGAVHKKVRGERMAERVGSDVLSNAGKASVFLNDALNAARGKTAEVTVLRNSALIFGVVDKEGRELVVTSAEIIFDSIGGGFVDEDGAVFRTLTTDDEFTAV